MNSGHINFAKLIPYPINWGSWSSRTDAKNSQQY